MRESIPMPETGDHIARISAPLARKLALAIGVISLGFVALWFSSAESGAPFNSHAFILAFGIGIAAQLIDGALGMAYGLSANTLLLAIGLPPAAATASVHVAEAFTTAASGLSHWRLGNIDKRIFGRIVIPGVIGAVIGVLVVTSIDGKILRPWISAYLLGMGLFILYRAFRPVLIAAHFGNRFIPVAFLGGFVDSVGGGGWGPVVTTTLIGSGHEPKTTIGSVNAAEFFVTLASGFSFILLLGIQHWESVAGLVLGGLMIAPFAAALTRHLNRQFLMVLVGLVISALSLWTIFLALGV